MLYTAARPVLKSSHTGDSVNKTTNNISRDNACFFNPLTAIALKDNVIVGRFEEVLIGDMDLLLLLIKYKTRNVWQSLAYSSLGAAESPPSEY